MILFTPMNKMQRKDLFQYRNCDCFLENILIFEMGLSFAFYYLLKEMESQNRMAGVKVRAHHLNLHI